MEEAGIAVVAFDSIGSGYSEGIKGGLRNYFDSMDTLAADTTMMLKKVRADYEGKKVFLMGESFGGTVIVTQLLNEQKKPDGDLADGYLLAGPVIKLLRKCLHTILFPPSCFLSASLTFAHHGNSGNAPSKASGLCFNFFVTILSDVDNARHRLL